jgi:hypothetical protein
LKKKNYQFLSLFYIHFSHKVLFLFSVENLKVSSSLGTYIVFPPTVLIGTQVLFYILTNFVYGFLSANSGGGGGFAFGWEEPIICTIIKRGSISALFFSLSRAAGGGGSPEISVGALFLTYCDTNGHPVRSLGVLNFMVPRAAQLFW